MSSALGKRAKIDECENQDLKQNPNDDSSAPSLRPVESKKRRQMVSKKAVRRRRKSVRERKVAIERDAVRERRTPPEWVVEVMREENGVDAKLIIEKNLKESDLNRKLTRLLIPFNQIEDMDFLNEKELQIIDEDLNKIRKKGVDVTLVDFTRKKWKVNLKRWDMTTSPNYVLSTGWNDVAAGNMLKENQKIRLWSFRSADKLFLTMVPPDHLPLKKRLYLWAMWEANRKNSLVSVDL